MYFTDEALLPERIQEPLIITAAPYGPVWMPADWPEDIPVSWDAQVQKAVDCWALGATVLHVHVRDPETGHISKNFKQYSEQVGRLRAAVPKMIPCKSAARSRLLRRATRRRTGRATTPGTCSPRSIRKPDQITVTIGLVTV